MLHHQKHSLLDFVLQAWQEDGQLTADLTDSALDSIGNPVLELFVRRGLDGSLQSQGVALGQGRVDGDGDVPLDGITVRLLLSHLFTAHAPVASWALVAINHRDRSTDAGSAGATGVFP